MTLEQMMYWKQQEGLKQGREEGREEGALAKEAEMVCRLHSKGKTVQDIAELLDIDETKVLAYIKAGKPE